MIIIKKKNMFLMIKILFYLYIEIIIKMKYYKNK